MATGWLSAAALLYGLGLTLFSSTTHLFTRQDLVGDLSLALLILGGIGAVLWGRTILGTRLTALLVAFGMAFGTAINGPSGDLNFWKGGWATPLIVLTLAFAYRRALLSMVVLLALAAISVTFDTRAQAVVLVLCALVVGWQLRPAGSRRRFTVAGTTAVLLGVAVLAYHFGTQALVRGLLGSEAQQRSVEQIDNAGSLILGGRPEIAATFALMKASIAGYGFGVLPNTADVTVAKAGMARINYDPNNGYVERFMFGRGFELHSVVGDLWICMGLAGVLLSLTFAVVMVQGLSRRLPLRNANGLVIFLAFWSSWNLAFSPLLNAALPLVLAVGLLAPRVDGDEVTDAGAAEACSERTGLPPV